MLRPSLLVPFFLLIAVIALLYSVQKNTVVLYLKHPTNTNVVEFKALPEINSKVATKVTIEDARAEALEDFFKMYKSPLTPYAPYFVEAADENQFDFRLLPAIAMHESGLCKKIPKKSYNCFGYGIYGDKVVRFKSFEDAIAKVSRAIAKEYIQKGYETPQQIMKKYTPGSNGSWAESISFYMDKIYTIL